MLGFCSLLPPFGAIRGIPLLRLTALGMGLRDGCGSFLTVSTALLRPWTYMAREPKIRNFRAIPSPASAELNNQIVAGIGTVGTVVGVAMNPT